jgi:hypothetical protein
MDIDITKLSDETKKTLVRFARAFQRRTSKIQSRVSKLPSGEKVYGLPMAYPRSVEEEYWNARAALSDCPEQEIRAIADKLDLEKALKLLDELITGNPGKWAEAKHKEIKKLERELSEFGLTISLK